jgi:signal transduction histidine kinase
VRSEGDHVSLAVHNGGTSIPAELLPILFDPFSRAERADIRQGGQKSHGLGLYITREIVVAHGGAIDVSSSSEAGTTFTVRLPRGVPAFAAPQLSP